MFMSLSTDKPIHGYIWDTLPVGENVIKRVHQVANDEGQPIVANNFK